VLKKITDNLFYLFIFLLPWQTVFILREPMINGEKWQYGTIGIYLTDIILLAWLVAVFLCKTKNSRSKDLLLKIENCKLIVNCKLKIVNYISNSWQNKINCLLLIFLLWSIISSLWSPDKTLAFYFSLKLLLGAGLFLALQRVKINWRKIIFVFLTAAVLQSALAIGQFASQGSFSSKWLGMNNYEVWRGGVSVLENEGGRWLRAYGSFPHPNILGGYLAVAFLLGMMIVSREQRAVNNMSFPRRRESKFFKPLFNSPFSKGRKLNLPLWKRWRMRVGVASAGDLKPKNSFAKLLILSSLLIILLGILLTFSRSAWLALAVGIIFLGASIDLKKDFIKLLLIFSLAGIVFISVNYENFSTRFDTGKRLEQKSISERSLYFNQSKKIIKENFWLGTGAGNYTLAVFQSTFAFAAPFAEVATEAESADKKDEIKKPIWQYQPVHNIFMLIWAELGIIGLILFILILTQIFLKSLKNKTLFCCLLFVVCCLLFLDHWLWTTHFGILFFWLIAGLAVKPK